MMNRIRRLSPEVASQIAAGEVIERPVSVVKELLENALDAQATEIEIFIEGGGVGEIRIEDNGHGISETDLRLAIEPHATSKIASLAELYQTKTKGFRGEALASIASVSRLNMISRPKGQACAVSLSSEAGQINQTPAIRTEGTSIIIRDLFYNVPVRKKFLKSATTEWQAIENFVKRFALSAPEVHISLYHQGHLVADFPRALIQTEHLFRIRKIWGKRFYESSIWVDVERSGLRIWGWLGDLSEHRSQTDRLWIYLNGRMVQDKLLTHALKQIYSSLLPVGRHPACVLYLEIPPSMVDINVHPAKQEVRFEQPRLVYDFILSSIKPYWQREVPISISMPVIDTPPVAYPALSSLSTQQSFICNTDYIILPVSQHLMYLVDVPEWFNYILRKRLKSKPLPWQARISTMPFIREITKINEHHRSAIEEKLRLWGIDLQFWDNDRVCIRSIPADLPQFNVQQWVKQLKPQMHADDLHINDLFACCQFSAYDVDAVECENIKDEILNQAQSQDIMMFARCLDYSSCRKLFK
jgi:DNA mismatch repair protein MutL